MGTILSPTGRARGLGNGSWGSRTCLAGGILGILLARVLVTAAMGAEISAPSEHQLKAAFVFNFSKFVTWSDPSLTSTNLPLVIGVFDDPRVARELANLTEGKAVGARAVLVKESKDLSRLAGSHILYVGGSSDLGARGRIAESEWRGVLTVGDAEDFLERGGVIGFVWEGKKLRFQINLDRADQGGIKMSSHLLRLAQKVIRSDASKAPENR